MNFSQYIPDLVTIGPELILCATILVVLLVDLWRQGRDRTIVWLLAPVVTFAAIYGVFAAGRAYLENPPPGTAWQTRLENPLWPEFLALVLAYAMVTVGDIWFRNPEDPSRDRDKWVPGGVAMIGVLLAGYRFWNQAVPVFSATASTETVSAWGGLVSMDAFALVFRGIILASLALSTWFTIFYRPMQRGPASRGIGEFLVCLIGAHIGALLLVTTTNLLFIFVSLEMLSLCSYLQAGMLKGDRRSAEASLKYVVYGSVASGMMLFGFSLLYGFAGSMSILDIAAIVQTIPKQGAAGVLLTLGLLATIGGLAYKLSLVPFHFWTPDVYQGAPTPTTAFLSVGSKAAAFAILLRLLYGFTGDINWTPSLISLLAFGSALTMTYGNFAALRQSNLKRLIAYSSIAHAGYMLMGVVALFAFTRDPDGTIVSAAFRARGYESILFYLIAYLLMNFGAFGAIIYLANRTGSEDIDDICGLGWKSPWVGAAVIVFLLSLTGVPPTAGFFAKYYLFAATIQAGFVWLAVIAALNTILSLFYYFRIAKALFLKNEQDALFEAPHTVLLAGCILVLAALTLYVGVFPERATTIVEAATSSLRK